MIAFSFAHVAIAFIVVGLALSLLYFAIKP